MDILKPETAVLSLLLVASFVVYADVTVEMGEFIPLQTPGDLNSLAVSQLNGQSVSYDGFTLSSKINGTAGGEIAVAGNLEWRDGMGVGGTGSTGFTRSINNDGSTSESIDFYISPTAAGGAYAGLSAFAVTGGKSTLVISGFAEDPQAGVPEGTVSYSAGVLTWTQIAAYASPVEMTFTNLNAAPAGTILNFSNGLINTTGNKYGFSSFTYAVDPSVVQPPDSLTVVATNNAQLLLEWSVIAQAESYNIYRGLAEGAATNLYESAMTGTSYVDTGVTNYTTYFYMVTAVSNASESLPSPEAFAFPYDTTDTVPPAAPVDLTCSVTGVVAYLDWSDNSEEDLAGYTIYRSTSGGVDTSDTNNIIVSGLTASTYTDSALLTGETYFYVITATDIPGNESADSTEVSGTIAVPSGEANIYFVAANGVVYGFTSIGGDGVACTEQLYATNGIVMGTNTAYGAYQAFFSTPNGKVYGVGASGDVEEWSSVNQWLAGTAPATLAVGVYDPATTNGINGASYDGDSGGFFVVYGGTSHPLRGDVGQYADLTALLADTPFATHAADYNVNLANFYYPYDDAPGNYTAVTNQPGAQVFQVHVNGHLQGFQSLADYATGDTEMRTTVISDFGNMLSAAFAVFPSAGIGNVSIAPAGAHVVVKWQGANGSSYILQTKSDLVLDSSWSNVQSGIVGADITMSATTTVTSAKAFYRIVAE